MPLFVYLLASAVFAQGTSEFMLAGLVTGIARELDVSLQQAGLLTTAYAVGILLGAPVMAAWSRLWSPRLSLAVFLVAFAAAHLVAAATDDFGVLLLARVIAAVANAGFLSVTLATVARTVPTALRPRALSVILGGTTLALIAGVPLGAVLGETYGWRSTMWAVALICVPAFVAVLMRAPLGAERDSAPALRQELATLARPALQHVLLLAVLVNAATFGGFAYLAPLATTAGDLPTALVPLALALFGLGAFGGVTLAGRLGEASWGRVVGWGSAALVLGWAALVVTLSSAPLFLALCAVVGGLSFLVGGTLIARIVGEAGPGAPTMGGAFATVALNLGAAFGPVLVGAALAMSPAAALLTCAALAGTAALVRGPRS